MSSKTTYIAGICARRLSNITSGGIFLVRFVVTFPRFAHIFFTSDLSKLESLLKCSYLVRSKVLCFSSKWTFTKYFQMAGSLRGKYRAADGHIGARRGCSWLCHYAVRVVHLDETAFSRPLIDSQVSIYALSCCHRPKSSARFHERRRDRITYATQCAWEGVGLEKGPARWLASTEGSLRVSSIRYPSNHCRFRKRSNHLLWNWRVSLLKSPGNWWLSRTLAIGIFFGQCKFWHGLEIWHSKVLEKTGG